MRKSAFKATKGGIRKGPMIPVKYKEPGKSQHLRIRARQEGFIPEQYKKIRGGPSLKSILFAKLDKKHG